MSTVDISGNGHVIPVDVSSCNVRFDLTFGSSSWSDYNKVYVHYSNHIPSISPGTHADTNHHLKEVQVTEENFNRKSITIPDLPVFHIGADNVVDDMSANTFEFQIYHLDNTFNVINGNGKTVNVYGHMHAPSIINATEGNFSYTLEVEVPHYGDISNDISGFLVTTGGPTWKTGLSATDIRTYDYYGYNGTSDLSLNNYVLNTTFVDKSSFSYEVSANAGGEFTLDGSGNATFYLKVCDPSFAWVDISAGQLTREVINAENTNLFTKYRIENSVRLIDTSNNLGLISNSVYASGNDDPGALVNLTTTTNHANLSDISYTASGQGMNQTIHITGSAPLDMTLSNPYNARLFYTQSDISDSYTDSSTGNGVLNYVTDISLSDDLSSDALMNDLSTNHTWSVVDISLTSTTHTLDYYLTDISDGVPVYMFVQMIEMYDLSVNKATPVRVLGDIVKVEPFAPPPKISNISVSPHGTKHDASENYVYQNSDDVHVDFSLNHYVPSEVGDINKIIMYKEHVQGPIEIDVSGNVEDLSTETMLTGPFNLAPPSDHSYRLHISNSDISLTQGTDIEFSLLFANDYYDNTEYTTTNDYYSPSVDISVVDQPDPLVGVTFTSMDGDISNEKGYVHIEVPAETVTNTWDVSFGIQLQASGGTGRYDDNTGLTVEQAKAYAIQNGYTLFRKQIGGMVVTFFKNYSSITIESGSTYDSYVLSSTDPTPLSGTDGMGNNYSGLTEIPVTLFIEPVGDIATDASNVFVDAYTDLSNVDRSNIEHPMADVNQPSSSQTNLVYHTLLTRPNTSSNFELDVYSPLDVVDFSYSIAARNDKYTLSRNSGNNQHTYVSDDSDIADLMGDLNWSSKTQLVTKHGFTNTLTAVNGPFVGQPNNNDATITLTFHETEDGFYGRGDYGASCVVVLEDSNGTPVPVKGTGLTEANKPTQVAPLIVTYDVSGINGGDISGGHTFRYYLKNTVDDITGPDASGTFYTRSATNPPHVQFLSGTSSDDSLSITPTTVNFIRITMPDLSGGANYGGDASFNDDKSEYTLHVELLKDSTVQVQSHAITGAVSDQTYFDFSDNTIGIPNAGASFDMRLRELEPNTLYTVKSYIENITIISPETKSSSGISSIDISATDKTIEDNSGSFATITTLSGAVKSDNRFSPALDLEHVDLSWTAVSPQHDSGVEGYAVIATISGEDYTVWSGTDTDVSFHSGHKFFQTNTSTLLSSNISSSHNQSLDTLATSFNLTEIKTPIYGLPIEYRVRTIFKDQDNFIYTGGASYNDQIDSNKTTALTPKTRPTIESVTVNYDASGEYITGFDISLSTGGDPLDKVLVLVTGENMTPVVHQAPDLSDIPVSGSHSHPLLQDISFAGTGDDKDNDSIIMINSPQGGNLYHLNDLKDDSGMTPAIITTTTTREHVQLGQDLDGEAANDNYGRSVSLSSDGSIVAIGATGNDGSGNGAGHVRVFQWNGTTWAPMGGDIDGEFAGDGSGYSVSLSSDGSTVAIGSPYNDENGYKSGHVRVFQWNGTTWAQMGGDIDGEEEEDEFGESVSLSSDGSIVAIGTLYHDNAGHVRVFQWDGTTWAPMGGDIDGESGGDQAGYSVSLSSNGSIVAIGATGNDGNGNGAGHVRVFQWNGETWQKIGGDIDGEAASDESGYSVSLSSDGSTVAIGAPYNDGNGSNAGHVRVWALSAVETQVTNIKIKQYELPDPSHNMIHLNAP